MKNILIPVLLLNTLILQAQNIGVNATGIAPDASAMLDVSSADKGLLIPRIALTGTNVATPVTAPATSLMVYNTATAGTGATSVTPGFYYWDGTEWVKVISGNTVSTTDDQNLIGATLTGTNLQIDIENGSSAIVNLAALQDGTGTDSQTLGLSGNTLSISGGNSVSLLTDPFYLGLDTLGGIVYEIHKESDGLQHGLIVNKNDNVAVWQASATTTGATSTWDGAYNTSLMTNSAAAIYVNGLTDGGFSDWYIPSLDELNSLKLNRGIVNKALSGTVGVTLLPASYFVWSSTERSNGTAYFVEFYDPNNNVVSSYLKSNTKAIRAIRAF